MVLEDRITITAQSVELVQEEGITDEVDVYSSNVYLVEDVEPVSGGLLQSDPYWVAKSTDFLV